jgi:hypothetical protein
MGNMAASARGGAENQLLAMRNAQAAGAQQMAQNNNQAGQLRASEIANAMTGQSGLLQNMQTGDLQITQQRAANEQAQRQLNDKMTQDYEKNRTDMNNADIQAKTGVTTANAGVLGAKQGNLLSGAMGSLPVVGGMF